MKSIFQTPDFILIGNYLKTQIAGWCRMFFARTSQPATVKFTMAKDFIIYIKNNNQKVLRAHKHTRKGCKFANLHVLDMWYFKGNEICEYKHDTRNIQTQMLSSQNKHFSVEDLNKKKHLTKLQFWDLIHDLLRSVQMNNLLLKDLQRKKHYQHSNLRSDPRFAEKMFTILQ